MKKQLPMATGRNSAFPALQMAWLADLLPGPLPNEPNATCESCAMLPPVDAPPEERSAYFHPSTKCCTYHPSLPNFLVGRILEDDTAELAEGRTAIEAKIDSRVGVVPFGLPAPSYFDRLYDPDITFGRSPDLRCPYYSERAGGGCGIWRHRNGVCATWYCKHARGSVALGFWRCVDQLLRAAEQALAKHCMLELNLGPEALNAILIHIRPKTRLIASDLGGVVDEAAYRLNWGCWLGREREFYLECSRLVAAFTWQDVVTVGGVEVKMLARIVCEHYATMTKTRVPSQLSVGVMRIVDHGEERSTVVTYSSFDPISLSNRLLAAITTFDGSSTSGALRRLEKEHGIRLSRGALLKLVDFGVLVDARERSRYDAG